MTTRADELAAALVGERLAACVNVHGPMVSTYRWKGAVEREAERQIVIKTTRARLPALEARLRDAASVRAAGVGRPWRRGSEAYGQWVMEMSG